MREIKFRAWDIERKEFNFMDLRDAIASDDAYALCGNQGTKWEEDRENSCTMNCKCELQQFTGLKDKNRKEIYEGDIVKTEYNEEVIIQEVKFHNGAFSPFYWQRTYGIDYQETNLIEFLEFEVIGNKYENPELL